MYATLVGHKNKAVFVSCCSYTGLSPPHLSPGAWHFIYTSSSPPIKGQQHPKFPAADCPKMPVEQSVAASRLAVLSRQLAGTRLDDPSAECSGSALSRNPTEGDDDESRPAPGGGRGTLTVVDNRTGKKYTVRRVCGFALRPSPPTYPSSFHPLSPPLPLARPHTARNFGRRHAQRTGTQTDQGGRGRRRPAHL